MKLTRSHIAWHTEKGRRANNEDCCGFHLAPDGSAGLLVVADGMGGAASGEVASQMALDILLHNFERQGFSQTPELLGSALLEAHARIQIEADNGASEKSGMGTTAVAVVIRKGEVIVGHIGDSRAFQFRLPLVRRLTQDHLFAIDVLGVAENQAKHHPQGNVLSQALGVEGAIRPAVHRFDAQAGDYFVLCSDGVSEHVDEPTMSACLTEADLQSGAVAMAQRAIAAGSRDNCTVMIANIAE
jgi:protein phosphatase